MTTLTSKQGKAGFVWVTLGPSLLGLLLGLGAFEWLPYHVGFEMGYVSLTQARERWVRDRWL